MALSVVITLYSYSCRSQMVKCQITSFLISYPSVYAHSCHLLAACSIVAIVFYQWNTVHMIRPQLPFSHCFLSWRTEDVRCFDISLKMTMRPPLNRHEGLLICNLPWYCQESGSHNKANTGRSPPQESLRLSHTRFMSEIGSALSETHNNGIKYVFSSL